MWSHAFWCVQKISSLLSSASAAAAAHLEPFHATVDGLHFHSPSSHWCVATLGFSSVVGLLYYGCNIPEFHVFGPILHSASAICRVSFSCPFLSPLHICHISLQIDVSKKRFRRLGLKNETAWVYDNIADGW